MIVLTEIPPGRVRIVGTRADTSAGFDCVESLTEQGYRVVAILERVSTSPMTTRGGYDNSQKWVPETVIGTSTMTRFDYVMSLDQEASLAAAAKELAAVASRIDALMNEREAALTESRRLTDENKKLTAERDTLSRQVEVERKLTNGAEEEAKKCRADLLAATKRASRVRVAIGAIRYDEIVGETAEKAT